MNQIRLYDTIFTRLKNKWTRQLKLQKDTDFEPVTKQSSGYVSYLYPYPVTDSTYFSVKYSMDDLTRFVLIGPKGEERVIFTPGNLFDESITFGNDHVFWIESKPDIRWTFREFSLLRILNLKDGTLKEMKYLEKIYAPSLSADGKHLSAIKIDRNNQCSVVLISPVSAEIEKETRLSKELFVLTPSWTEKNDGLIAVVLGSKGKSLARIDPYTGLMDILMPFSYNELMRPVQRGNWIYYTGSMSGTDDIYGFNLSEKINYRITKSKFGVRDVQPALNGKNLVYSNYTSDGYKLVKRALKPSEFSPLDTLRSHQYKMANKLSSQEKEIADFSKPDTMIYPSKSYSKLDHLFNFHSWAPVHIDVATDAITPGLSLLSQNKLSTAITQLGYDYSTINKSGKWVGEFEYTGLSPVFKLSADYGNQRSQYLRINTFTNPSTHTIRKDTQQVNFYYKVLDINGLVNIPLNLSHGSWNRLIQPEFQLGYTQIWQEPTTSLNNSITNLLTYRIYSYNVLQTSLRDIQPAIGQVIDLNYHYSPITNVKSNKIWTAEGTLYFPGLFRHHGIRIYGGYQHKELSGNLLNDYILYPRGYANLLNSQLFCLKSDYVLPLFYPDWSLGRFSYIKRIALRVFYDQAWATVPIINQNNGYHLALGSVGGEWTVSCNFFRLYVPSLIGLRTSYLISQNKINLELLLSINFGAL